jgi:dTDP-4-amino-4,6-dideoxygalactose transaminase
MHVPFVDLQAQYRSLKKKLDTAISEVIESAAFIKGPHVEVFEKSFAALHSVSHCIGVANGTDALYISLKMLGIGPGDEVITTALSWISTSESISQTGAKPVFVDIEPDFFSLDCRKAVEKITPRTRAVIPVHLYGHPADLGELKRICDHHGLLMIEDCAQAHLARFRNQLVGTFGNAATFSFYPGKNLGAYGDGGAIITDEPELARKMRMYANHGSLVKHRHEMEGLNSRLDGLQAAILNVKMPYLEEWNRKRAALAQRYHGLLKDVPEVELPKTRENCTHIFHVYCIRVPKRDDLRNYLEKNGIETSVHYPTALPFLHAYSGLNHTPQEFPVAFHCQRRILSLPMYAELTLVQQEYIAGKIREFFQLHS